MPAIAAPGADTDEVWIDYVSDVGDGFDATATVAWMLAQEQLVVDGGDAAACGAPMLVLGGDQVYPFASLEEYEDRFVGPVPGDAARTPTRPHPADAGHPRQPRLVRRADRVHAGLRPGPSGADGSRPREGLDDAEPGAPAPTAGRWIGGWLTAQRRSYFAVQAPHRAGGCGASTSSSTRTSTTPRWSTSTPRPSACGRATP